MKGFGKGDSEMEAVEKEIREELLARIDFSRELGDDEIMAEIEERVFGYGGSSYLPISKQRELAREIFNSVRRLGPLQQLIDDEDVTEIMVNGPNAIFIERAGELKRYDGGMESEAQLEDIIQQIVAKVNRTVNEANPIVDARLVDGSRVNVVLPPIAMGGAALTIRKFPKVPMSMERLLGYGAITEEAAEFLKMIVAAGCNVIVSGGTSSGKTSFLNALADYIPKKERVIIIEDSAELQFKGVPNIVQMETRNANMEGKGEIRIDDLIKSSLRMRPDRIVVGEVRDGPAAVNLLNAFNTGHFGEATIHSNSATDTVGRLETLVLMGSDIPLAAAKRQIASAIDYIVHLGRLPTGERKLLEIEELRGIENGEIRLGHVFKYSDENKRLERVGKPEYALEKLIRAGFEVEGAFG